MNGWAIGLVARSLLVGLGVGLALSPGELVSLEAWFIAAVSWLAINLLIRLLGIAGIESIPLATVWTWHRPPQIDAVENRPRELRAVEVMLTSAVLNDRVGVRRVGPRMCELADHSLRTEGSLRNRQERFGELTWMLDPTDGGRTPTFDEIDRFLDLVTDPLGDV